MGGAGHYFVELFEGDAVGRFCGDEVGLEVGVDGHEEGFFGELGQGNALDADLGEAGGVEGDVDPSKALATAPPIAPLPYMTAILLFNFFMKQSYCLNMACGVG